MKIVLTILLLASLLLGGCGVNSTPYTPVPTPSEPEPVVPILTPTPIPTPTPTPIPTPIPTPTSTPTPTPTIVLPGEPPIDRTWISPGKVNIGNFYPGARAEYPLLVHNGKDTAASFSVGYRYPDHVGEGYTKPLLEVQDWVIIADATPVLLPKETREILIVLAMPGDAAVLAPKWEFWISVKDTEQVGMVQTELCSRWLVSMR